MNAKDEKVLMSEVAIMYYEKGLTQLQIANLMNLSRQTVSKLLNEAVKGLNAKERVYAFFHYFGMTCFARHGKLFEKHAHIETLLK